MKNIVLIGLPGSGKTTIGQQVAKSSNMRYLDLDEWIEEQEGASIPDLFASYGEPYFRMMETKAAQYASAQTSAVISCGGGIVLKQENMHMLGAGGIIVFIDRDPAAIISDIDTQHRPLLKSGADKIWELYRERYDLYRTYADYIIKNDSIAASLDDMESILAIAKRSLELAVIGDPISHSLSPEIHLAALKRICGHASYERIKIEKGKIGDHIDRLQRYYDGFNITMPHKADIIPYLNDMDTDARIYHSVNTAVKTDRGFDGYNTDGIGFASMVRDAGYAFEDKRITVMGAGGAAGTIAIKAAAEGAELVRILARKEEQAQRIANKIGELYPNVQTECADMSIDSRTAACKTTDILINGTPLGMHGAEEFDTLDFMEALPKDALTCDLIYHPMKTMFYLKAEALGLKVLGGIGMLIDQALIADELYIGHKLNMQSIQKRVIDTLIRKEIIS
ncbi:MAG: shikimate kinase [Anaerofustis sp.]